MSWVILPESFFLLSPALCRLDLLFFSDVLPILSSSSNGSDPTTASTVFFSHLPSSRDDFRSLDFLLLFFGSSKSSAVASILLIATSPGSEILSMVWFPRARRSSLLLLALPEEPRPFADCPVDDIIEVVSADSEPLCFDFFRELLPSSPLDLVLETFHGGSSGGDVYRSNCSNDWPSSSWSRLYFASGGSLGAVELVLLVLSPMAASPPLIFTKSFIDGRSTGMVCF